MSAELENNHETSNYQRSLLAIDLGGLDKCFGRANFLVVSKSSQVTDL